MTGADGLKFKGAVISFVFALLVYAWAVFQYTVNRPYYDDIPATLKFMNAFVSSDWAGKLAALFSPHNEHRLVFNHVIEVIDFYIFGEINFGHLVAVGFAGWLSVSILIWRWARKQGFSFWAFLPVALLLLNFSHFELMTWAMGGNQQYFQLLFCLISIYMLTSNRDALALLFFVFAIFTGGGGFALAPIFLGHYILDKNWRFAGLSVAIISIIAFIYFRVLPYEGLPSKNGDPKPAFNPFVALEYAVCFIGSIGRNRIFSLLVGLTFIALIVFLRKTFFRHRFLLAAVSFILCTSALTAVGRSHLGVEQATISRYREYSLLMAALIYLAALLAFERSPAKEKLTNFSIAGAMGFFAICLLPGIHGLQKKHGELQGEQIATFQPIEKALEVIRESEDLGVFYGDYGDNPVPAYLNVAPKR
jgi:hypothetical protein